MAYFIQLKSNNDTFEKCLNAIQTIGSTELWLDEFVTQSRKNNKICSSMNVLLHWWKSIKNTNVNWEYEKITNEKPSYYYENYRGLLLHIDENPYTGKSKVYHANGIPESIIEKLNDCFTEDLYEILETYVFNRILGFDDCELKILEKN